jgi:hypothetical protein
MRLLTLRGLAIALLVSLGGCGPIEYISVVTTRASRSVSAAEAAEGARCAPYEYTAAREYLRKAREEAGYADYEAALDFGRRAIQHGDKAREVALQRRAQDNCASALGPMAAQAPAPAPAPAAAPAPDTSGNPLR